MIDMTRNEVIELLYREKIRISSGIGGIGLSWTGIDANVLAFHDISLDDINDGNLFESLELPKIHEKRKYNLAISNRIKT